MIKRPEVDELEKLIGQLQSLHAELSVLSKKSSTDGVNTFKLQFINTTLKRCNAFFGRTYMPFDEFEHFNPDELPSNSDVTFIISQYMQAAEKFRSDNIYFDYGRWYYAIHGQSRDEGADRIPTAPPAKLKG